MMDNSIQKFQEADQELTTRLKYVIERANELVDCYDSRFSNEVGYLIDPAISWVFEILVTIAHGSVDHKVMAPDCAGELPLERLMEIFLSSPCGEFGPYESMPLSQYIEQKEAEDDDRTLTDLDI